MKEIFTDLYNKVLGFFQKQEREQEGATKELACNRLKLVLMQDRTNLTPFLLERMRGEMVEVLSKYVEMDKEALELSFEQEGEQMALMLSIPVIRAKDEEEIQAILDAEEKAKEEKEAAEEADSEDSEEIEEAEEETEVLEENDEEDVCSYDDEDEEISVSPDEIDEEDEEEVEEISEKKFKKKN